jgi:hypothetical protein
MEDSLILSENFPESINLFMGNSVYIVQEKVEYPTLDVLGENQLRFLHVIENPKEKFFDEVEKESFFKYINAIQSDKIKMDKDGFAILNLAQYPGISWENIKSILNPRICFFWGVNPLLFEMDVPQYNVSKIDELQVVFVDSISKTLSERELKLKLWDITKQIFNI